MSFQTRVNRYNPIAVAGDFASQNPRAAVLAGESALVAGPLGVTVGRFAWVSADGRTVTNSGEGAIAPTGFVHRDMNALITQYLAESSLVIAPGFMVTLFDAGDFFATVNGQAAVNGSTVYARYSDGAVFIGAAPAGTTGTGSIGATFTATGAGNQLAVSAVTGLLSIGDTLGTVAGVPAGTSILAQVSGTAGGAGVYTTSAVTTIAAATATCFGDVLDLTAVVGTLAVGDAVTGTGVPALATIASQVSGAAGGVGVYTLNIPATAYAAATALTVAGGILTKFVCKSAAAVGELVKISTWGN